MKIYVLLPDYGYEGYGEPEIAYRTRAEAEAKAATDKNLAIIEIELEEAQQ